MANTTTIDFGSTPVMSSSFVITDAAITPTSYVEAFVMIDSTSDNDQTAHQHAATSWKLSTLPASGSFTLFVYCLIDMCWGTFKIRYAGVPGLLATWDPAFKASAITLSNGNLTATGTGSGQAVFSTTAKSSGKVFFEVSFNQAPGILTSVGIANHSESTSVIFIGHDANGAALLAGNSNTIYANNVSLDGISLTSGAGDVASFAIDLGTSPPTLWVSNTKMRAASLPWNNSATANPNTNTGGLVLTGLATGPYFAAFGTYVAGDSVTANFGSLPFTIAVPTGFTSWDTSL